MRTASVFCAECICGKYFEAEQREFTCPNCKRVIVLAWGFAANVEDETKQDSDVPEAAA